MFSSVGSLDTRIAFHVWTYASLPALGAAMAILVLSNLEFLNAWNEEPRPFVWTAAVESILEKLARCRQTLEQIALGCTLPKRRKKQLIIRPANCETLH